MTETGIMRDIQVKLTASPDKRLFRNNVGVGFQGKATQDGLTVTVQHARRIRFGLCEGSSDLIGWTSVKVTPDMVGQRVAVFTALEVKDGARRPTKEQINFIEAVRAAGGIGAVVTSADDAARATDARAWRRGCVTASALLTEKQRRAEI